MGGNMGKMTKQTANGGQLTIGLFDPGMTALHRAGLAGLWMTLKALEDENGGTAALPGGSWARSPTSVTLRWDGAPKPFFDALFKRSFKIDSNGLIWFPAFGEPTSHPEHAVVLQEAMLGSFLQHVRTRKADKAADPKGALSVQIDNETIVLKYHRVTAYAHQQPDYTPTAANVLAGWHFPGGAVRHTGLGQTSTALEEAPGRALALRFAPVGVVFFEIRARATGVRPLYALVLPDILDLDKYAQARACFLRHGVQQLYAAGSADAGFRVLAELESAGMLDNLGSAACRVISFGTVPWSSQQKTRVHLTTVRAGSREALRAFALCRQLFSPRLVKPKGKDPFWDLPQVPDLVAQNLSSGRQWWERFGDFVADAVRRDHVFSYEKGGLAEMVEHPTAFPEGPERTFVAACHEAWRRRMAQIGEKARREGSSFPDQVKREFTKVRTAFARCKNAASLREAVTDFWARGGGPLRPLQDEGWKTALAMLSEKEWRKAKDLVLLALASYKPATKEEAQALQSQETPQTEGEE